MRIGRILHVKTAQTISNLCLRLFLSLLFMCATFAVVPSQASVGTWTNYMAYSEITDVEEGGNYLYVLASGSLFTYNTNDNSITTYDKATGLNDCSIQLIEWCQSEKTLVIVYEDGNIDLLSSSGTITNMSEYIEKTTTADKTIYGLDVIGSYAYISTGFGIVEVNVEDAEISNTYSLGIRVDYCYIDGGYIYAASSTNGIYRASTSDNLLDSSVWEYYAAYTAQDKSVDEDLLAIAESLSPGGPKYNYFGYMYFLNDRLYTSGGGWTTGKTYGRPGCVQVLEDGEWTIYQDDFTMLHSVSYQDACSIAVDPNDPDHVFVGTVHGGLLEFQDGEYVANYTYDNSILTSAVEGNARYVRVDGLVYGENGSLYMLNSEAEHALIEYTSDGEWVAHDYSCLYNGDVSLGILRRSILDSRGYIWFVNFHSINPAVFCYQPDYDAITEFSTYYNQNGTDIVIYNGFEYVAEDLDNNIWVASDGGPLLLTDDEMADNSLGFYQVVVPRNDGTDYGDYLLESVDVTCIAIDGAGRKWIGTNGAGVYLISEDNMTQEEHFTADETPLLSDYIEDIAIDGKTGEVYIGTSEGLCSYSSDATTSSDADVKTGETKEDEVYAYPNPVKPDYTGLISVVGLTYDADVKIVTVSGTLVAEGRSNGGMFTWDGCDTNGNRVASGIYFVQSATSTGEKGTVCKIAVIR